MLSATNGMTDVTGSQNYCDRQMSEIGIDKHQVWMTAHRSNRDSERVKEEDTAHRFHGNTKWLWVI